MWHVECAVLKVVEFCKITFMYIDTNSTRQCFVCKDSDINKFFYEKLFLKMQ